MNILEVDPGVGEVGRAGTEKNSASERIVEDKGGKARREEMFRRQRKAEVLIFGRNSKQS